MKRPSLIYLNDAASMWAKTEPEYMLWGILEGPCDLALIQMDFTVGLNAQV